MSQYFPPTLNNSTINSVFNSTDFTNQSGGSLTQTTADGRYILNTGRIPAITWTGNHTFSKAVSLGATDASFSNTFGGLSNIFNSNISTSSAINLGQKYYLNITSAVSGATTLGFALSEIYYITPSGTAAYTITLPTITSAQVGARLQLRVVNTATNNVTLTPAIGQSIYGTSTTAIGTNGTPLTIYTGNVTPSTTTISSFTYYALTTSLGGTYGWFQQ
jgi:hypothetical protein